MTENGQTLQRISGKELNDVLLRAHAEQWTSLVLLGPWNVLRAISEAWQERWEGCSYVFQLTESIDNLCEKFLPLTKLTTLHLLDNQIGNAGAKHLAALTNLTTLDLRDNEISDLSPIGNLRFLLHLNLSDTKVSDLSPLKWLFEKGISVLWERFRVDKGVMVENCQLVHPPPEVVKQGLEAVLNYFREIEVQGVDRKFEAKMLIVGEGRAGKTSLVRRLYQPDQPLPGEDETTKGIEICRHEFQMANGRTFRLNVWDFGGQQIYHATHQFFLTKNSLYILLDDTAKDHKSITDEGFRYWLEIIDLLSDHSPVLIFQNEKGGRSKAIDEGGIKGRFPNVKDVLVQSTTHGNEIVLRARGAEKKALLSVIASDLDALNASFSGLEEKLGKWIPCICDTCIVSTSPEFFEQKRLLQRKRDNKLVIECPASYQDVSVLELLDGLKLDQFPQWSKEKPEEHPNRSNSGTFSSGDQGKTIKIFLASSEELREDRDAFELYFRQLNDQLRTKGVYLTIVRWENFLDAMSETRLQYEYHQHVRACDIFISLFLTKTGKYTEEEFDVAHQAFKEYGTPQIYTFFKDASISTTNAPRKELQSLWAFHDKLKELGHWYTVYNSIEHLKRQFRDQLDKLFEQGKI